MCVRDCRCTLTCSSTSSAEHGFSAKQVLQSHCQNRAGDGDSTTKHQLGSLPCTLVPPYPECCSTGASSHPTLNYPIAFQG